MKKLLLVSFDSLEFSEKNHIFQEESDLESWLNGLSGIKTWWLVYPNLEIWLVDKTEVKATLTYVESHLN